MTDVEKPKEQFLELSGIEIPKGAPAALNTLRAEIETTVTLSSMFRMREYCSNFNIDYLAWAGEDIGPKQITQIEQAFSTVLQGVDVGERLADSLRKPKDSEEFKYAKQIVDLIVKDLQNKQQKFEEFTGKRDSLSGEMVSGLLSTGAEKFKEGFAEHPILTTVASVATLVIGYNALQWEFSIPGFDAEKSKGQWLKTALLWGGVAWTANFFTETFTDKGIIDNVMGFFEKEDGENVLGQALDAIPGLSKKEAESLRHSLLIGAMPFEYFLNAYEQARNNHTYDINMSTLRNNEWGKKLPTKYFRQSYGQAMYKELEAMIGDDIGVFRTKYSKRQPENGKRGYYSLQEVVFAENYGGPGWDEGSDSSEDAPEEGGASGSSSSTGSTETPSEGGGSTEAPSSSSAAAGGVAGGAAAGSAERSSSSSGAAAESKEKAGAVPELTAQAEFAALHPVLAVGRNASSVMGFPLTYTSTTYTEGPDMTQHLFTDEVTGKRFIFRLKETMHPADKQDFTEECTEIRSFMEARMKRKFPETGLVAPYAPSWNGEKWVILPAYEYKFTGQTASLPLELKVNGDNELLLVYGHHEARTIAQLEPLLKSARYEAGLEAQFDSDPHFSAFRNLKVRVVNADSNPKIGSFDGLAEFEFSFDPAVRRFDVMRIEMTPKLRDYLVKQAVDSPEYTKLFEDLGKAGEQLSNWRWALDILSISKPDRNNYYWDNLVGFKKDQIEEFYRQELTQLIAKGKVSPRDIEAAYEESIGKALRDLVDVPAVLRAADSKGDKVAYEDARTEFETFGFSASYAREYENFLAELKKSGVDLAGIDRKNNREFNGLAFKIRSAWFEHSKPLRNRDLTPNQVAWIRDLNTKIIDQLLQAQRTNENWFQKYFDSGVSSTEFTTLAADLGAIPDYDETVDPLTEVVSAGIRDVLGNVDQSSYRIDTAHTDKIRIIFHEGTPEETIWIFDKTGQVTEQFSLTHDIINMKVLSLKSDTEFNHAYDRMGDIFSAMEDTNFWDWNNLKAGDFSEVFRGTIDDNAWRSLVGFKRQEAELHYRQDLEAAQNQYAKNPVALRQAVAEIDAKRGQTYSRYTEEFADQISTWAASKQRKTPPEKFTKAEYLSIYKTFSETSYGNPTYATYASAFREQLSIFDYAGTEALGGREPHDVLNAYCLLREKYTGSLRNVDAAKWTHLHDAYMRYINFRVMEAVRKAMENGQDVTGTWLDNVIGSDEVPRELEDILTFEAYSTKYGPSILASATGSFPYDPDRWNDLVKLLEDLTKKSGGGTPPAPLSVADIQKWSEDVRDDINAIFDPWNQKMQQRQTNDTKNYDPAKVASAIVTADTARDMFFTDIMKNPQDRNVYMGKYPIYLQALEAQCERSWVGKLFN